MLAAKTATHRFYLLYSPLWMVAVGLVLLSRAFADWRDLGHMLLGLAMAAPVWLAPLWLERGIPFARRYSLKAALFITLMSFLQNYFGTPLYFRYFGLEYRFPVTIRANGSPLFLSLMTVAYFSTYFALIEIGLRAVERWLAHSVWPGPRRLVRLMVAAGLSYAMALLETLFMANEHLSGYFAYADKQRMMAIGSLCYGTLLLISVLVFVHIDEDPAEPTPLSGVLWQALGANTLVLCAYEVYAHFLPPIS